MSGAGLPGGAQLPSVCVGPARRRARPPRPRQPPPLLDGTPQGPHPRPGEQSADSKYVSHLNLLGAVYKRRPLKLIPLVSSESTQPS